MSKEKKRISLSKTYLRYQSVLLVIFAILLIALWVKLSDYQKNVDFERAEKIKNLPASKYSQDIFDEYMDSVTANDLLLIYKEANPSFIDREETILDLFNEKLNDSSNRRFESEDFTEEKPVYVFGSSKEKFLTVALKKTGEKSYEIGDVSINLVGDITSTIEVPEGSRVFANEIILTDDKVVDTKSYYPATNYAEDLVNPINFVTYEINGLFKEADFAVEYPENITIEEDDDIKYCIPSSDCEELKETAIDFVDRLLHMYMYGSLDTSRNASRVCEVLAKGSKAVTLVETTKTSMQYRQPVTNNTYYEEAISCYQWADNCISIDVSYETTDGGDNQSFSAAGVYRVYFYDFGSGMKIYWFTLK